MYFECIVGNGGSGGGGIPLIVNCNANFSGSIISVSDGTTTLTAQCPSSSPYTVVFALPNVGTWTASGVYSGTTFYSDPVTIVPYETNLETIPDGATVTPTNDVQILLNCANIWDKTSYTSITDLLADTTSLLAVISNNNAADYLVRSTSFASAICANSTAMTYIGANDYCADLLLGNSTWCNAICNSTYFESVLNVKVPTMTSNTTPSGEVIYSYAHPSQAVNNYKAFDGVKHGSGSTDNASIFTGNIGYKFTTKNIIKKVVFDEYFYLQSQMPTNPGTIIFEGSNDNLTWDAIGTINVTPSWQSWVENQGANFASNVTEYQYYRIRIASAPLNETTYAAWDDVQFYGRA